MEKVAVISTRAAVHNIVKELGDDFALLPTSRGLEALVDTCFLKSLTRHRWFAVISRNDHIYAVADINGKRVSLQRYVKHLSDPSVPLEDIKQVSFKNKCSFDCRLDNLLAADGRQSVMRNRQKKSTSKSQFKGVIHKLRSDGSRYYGAQIKTDTGIIYLGGYSTEVEAAKVYDAAATVLFGGSGYLNFPNEPVCTEYFEDILIREKRKRAKTNAKQVAVE